MCEEAEYKAEHQYDAATDGDPYEQPYQTLDGRELFTHLSPVLQAKAIEPSPLTDGDLGGVAVTVAVMRQLGTCKTG
jgi:hypothetical protein